MGNLSDRMKTYEGVSRNYLTRRMPVIIRIDGKAFHSFTKGFQRPFDTTLHASMVDTAKALCAGIQNCRMAYTQSDEISLLLVDYDNIDTEAWLKNNIQKMASISASMATMHFNKIFREKSRFCHVDDEVWTRYQRALDTAMFDSRVFSVPANDVCNYFIWRQQDATKNSIQMVARAHFSHKSLQGLNGKQLQEKLFQEKQINWSTDFTTEQKRGHTIVKDFEGRWIEDFTPIFSQDRDFIERFLPESKG